jgi:hypothetical protein
MVLWMGLKPLNSCTKLKGWIGQSESNYVSSLKFTVFFFRRGGVPVVARLTGNLRRLKVSARAMEGGSVNGLSRRCRPAG